MEDKKEVDIEQKVDTEQEVIDEEIPSVIANTPVFGAIALSDTDAQKRFTFSDFEKAYGELETDEDLELVKSHLINKNFKSLDGDFLMEEDVFKRKVEEPTVAIETINDEDGLTKNTRKLKSQEDSDEFESEDMKAKLEAERREKKAHLHNENNNLFGKTGDYHEGPFSLKDSDGNVIARRVFGKTTCSPSADMKDVHASFVNHLERNTERLIKGKPFYITLPLDSESVCNNVVDKVLVKLITDGLIEVDQLVVPAPYNKRLREQLAIHRDSKISMGNGLTDDIVNQKSYEPDETKLSQKDLDSGLATVTGDNTGETQGRESVPEETNFKEVKESRPISTDPISTDFEFKNDETADNSLPDEEELDSEILSQDSDPSDQTGTDLVDVVNLDDISSDMSDIEYMETMSPSGVPIEDLIPSKNTEQSQKEKIKTPRAKSGVN